MWAKHIKHQSLKIVLMRIFFHSLPFWFWFSPPVIKSLKPMQKRQWNYKHLIELNNSPGNGNADIYWVETDFIEKLKKSIEWLRRKILLLGTNPHNSEYSKNKLNRSNSLYFPHSSCKSVEDRCRQIWYASHYWWDHQRRDLDEF